HDLPPAGLGPTGQEPQAVQRLLREMPSFFIMAFRVVRGTPSRVAVMLMTPPVSRKTRRLYSLSICSRVEPSVVSTAEALSSANGARSVLAASLRGLGFFGFISQHYTTNDSCLVRLRTRTHTHIGPCVQNGVCHAGKQ